MEMIDAYNYHTVYNWWKRCCKYAESPMLQVFIYLQNLKQLELEFYLNFDVDIIYRITMYTP